MIKWNEVTWYSWYGALLLFLVILPVLSFYIGRQYEKTVEYLQNGQVVDIGFVPHRRINQSSPGAVHNQKKDMWAENLGKQGIVFGFSNVPAETTNISVLHGTSPSGPWMTDVNSSYAEGGSVTVPTDGTKQTLYYKAAALSASSTVLKEWGMVLVKKSEK